MLLPPLLLPPLLLPPLLLTTLGCSQCRVRPAWLP
jgi:hypothetical protein